MKITPAPLNISRFFSGRGQQFLIPAYQRRYSWKDKQLAELFNDINLLKKDDAHLLGTILCLSQAFIHGINALELVDGQQRITSLMILLKVIQERYIELDQKKKAEEINNFLYCEGIDGKRQDKVVLGDLDGPDYQKLMKRKNLELIKNENLVNAYGHFQKRLNNYNLEELNILYFKLINNVIIISLDTSEAKDAYKLFETINNRGLKLSATDIIKNFLLGHASMIKKNVLEEARNNWRELIINLDGISTDNFFRQYMSGILKRKVPQSRLINEFKRHYVLKVKDADEIPGYQFYKDLRLKDKESGKFEEALDKKLHDKTKAFIENKENSAQVSIVTFSQLLKKASSVYGKLLNKKFKNNRINRHLFNLERIRSVPSYIFLLNLFQRKLDDNSKIAVLKLLEAFMLRRNICQYRTGELDDIFSNLVKITNEDIVTKVRENLLGHFPNDSEFRDKFLSQDFKGERERSRARYILERVEYDLIKDKGEYVLSSAEDLHLEHIIPQTINTKKAKREFGDWVKYLGRNALERHNKYVNKIGNLTLLAKKLNIVASNNPFKAKVLEYKKSNIRLTKEIVDNFKEFKFREVENRSKELAKKAPEIWNLNL